MSFGWINVKDRLPENREEVLTISRGIYTIGFFHNGWFEFYMGGAEPLTLEITHWMPLPKPPEVE